MRSMTWGPNRQKMGNDELGDDLRPNWQAWSACMRRHAGRKQLAQILLMER